MLMLHSIRTPLENRKEVLSARCAGLVACKTCGRVHKNIDAQRLQCSRCGAQLHSRKPNSMMRTWALLMASLALYFPANMLPMLHTQSLFDAKDDTLISGIIYFWKSGSPLLATVVFIASIVVPLVKLGALNFLAFTTHAKTRWQPQQRAKLYRFIQHIGRWSMLDIFVLMLTVTLVQFRSLAVITAGPGALAFALVVIFTMLASMQFDARLIWDYSASSQPNHGLSQDT